MPAPASDEPHDEPGFALLIVLWSMALLALLATQVTSAGRADTRLAASLRASAQLEASADGAVWETIWHMLDGGGDYWPPGAASFVLQEPASKVTVTVEDERGKLDVNQVPPALLQALFSTLGADRSTAQAVANAISDWRTEEAGDRDDDVSSPYIGDGKIWGPPGQEIQRLDELQMVHGMTPALYRASLPYLTVALEQGPWLSFASPTIVAALAKAKRDSNVSVDNADQRGPVVLRIQAKATGANHTAVTRNVWMRLDGTLSGPAWHYRILAWEAG